MALKITHRKEQEVPAPAAGGAANEELFQLKTEMSKLAIGMVLEVDAGSAKSIAGPKVCSRGPASSSEGRSCTGTRARRSTRSQPTCRAVADGRPRPRPEHEVLMPTTGRCETAPLSSRPLQSGRPEL